MKIKNFKVISKYKSSTQVMISFDLNDIHYLFPATMAYDIAEGESYTVDMPVFVNQLMITRVSRECIDTFDFFSSLRNDSPA